MRIGEYPPQGLAACDDHSVAESGNATSGPAAGGWAAFGSADGDTEPALAELEARALTALGFSKPMIATWRAQALANGTTLEAELSACGEISEDAYYGAIARLLRLPFTTDIDAELVKDMPMLDSQLQRPSMIRIAHRNRAPQLAIVPQAGRLAELAATLLALPLLGRDLVVTTPSAVRRAVWAAGAARRGKQASGQLFETEPRFSARVVLWGSQGFIAGAIVSAIVASLFIAPMPTLLFLHVVLSLTYLTSLLLRLAALVMKVHTPPAGGSIEAPPGFLPRYTVMVALYKEAPVAAQLVASLSRLDWPPSLLEIKLVCEEDDLETIGAIEAIRPGPQFEIVRVPNIGPRTKPKALTYALTCARGEYLAIYDAEDRPHPHQLREAHARFCAGPPELACLQAPLIIANPRQSFISTMFSLEYSALFRGLLPLLAHMRMPLPLGGTSNHFKTKILREVGGWDPYNVTEDADIGLRLYRLGYRADVITRQTLEDAPVDTRVWMPQRARWFKGWLQTWLVLMRDPIRLMREMGPAAFLTFHFLIGSMLVSALLHPLIFVFLWLGASAMLQAPADELPFRTVSLFVIDFANILGSYLTFLGLGVGSMIDHEKRLVGRRWALVPFYWLMISAASWRAVIELKTKPFHWNKTPHKPVAKS